MPQSCPTESYRKHRSLYLLPLVVDYFWKNPQTHTVLPPLGSFLRTIAFSGIRAVLVLDVSLPQPWCRMTSSSDMKAVLVLAVLPQSRSFPRMKTFSGTTSVLALAAFL